MTDRYIEKSDAELDEQSVGFLRQHAIKLLKAPITAAMGGFSVWIFSGSIAKALIVAAICVLLSAFNTWRRFLEPLVFFAFVVAVIFWCDQDVLSRLR